MREIESAKLEGYLPGLSYLDTAQGGTPIASKLPHNLQEKWMSLGSQYKMNHQVVFPPFSYFTDFVCREAHTRNDPSFTLSLCDGNVSKPDYSMKRQGQLKSLVSANKTDLTRTNSRHHQQCFEQQARHRQAMSHSQKTLPPQTL